MTTTVIRVDAFDQIYRAARDRGIDSEQMSLSVETITDQGDIMIQISDEEEI